MTKLLFDEDPDNEIELYNKHVVSFDFDETINPTYNPYWKKTISMGEWILENLEEDAAAVITDHPVFILETQLVRRIEYGFLNKDDALLFKLTWAGI